MGWWENVLVKTESGWAQALAGHPSTHILKPQLSGHYSNVILDEEYGSRLARKLRLALHATEVRQFGGTQALVIQRFDRDQGRRVHQEDFNQILGASGNQKYQEVGAKVSLARIAATLARSMGDQQVAKLARLTVLATAIGNLDMHAKNISVLHPVSEQCSLAPAYDAVPQLHMPGDGRMALAINGKYRHSEITGNNLVSELSSWGVRKADSLVQTELDELVVAAHREAALPGAAEGLQEQIITTATRLAAG